MIIYSELSIFDIDADILVNTINCRGIMGSGIALEFSLRYPDLLNWYKIQCGKGKIKIGECYLFETDDCKVLNFPTKDDPYQPSRLDYIDCALSFFANNYKKYIFDSIAFPLLGCTSGKLSFDDVKPVMEKYLSGIDKTIYICYGTKQGNGLDRKLLEKLNELNSHDISGVFDKEGKSIIHKYDQMRNLTFFHEIKDLKLIDLKTYKRLYKKIYYGFDLCQNHGVGKKIACLGDSLTVGVGSSDKRINSYPANLNQLLNGEFEVKNFGVSNACICLSSDHPYFETREYENAINAHSNIYIVMFGTNDSKRNNWNVNVFANSYELLLNEIKKSNKEVEIILLIPPKIIDDEKYNTQGHLIENDIREHVLYFGKTFDAKVIDLFEQTNCHPELYSDAVHLNNRGYEVIANSIASLIDCLQR